ncbi:MAG: transketolase C-terminal domain-containing protein [Pirellulales bacterium]
MRTAFIQHLIEHARTNPRLFLVVGDLGYSVVEPFAAEFPDRFLNAGVAEQNMTGVAAGLAAEGYHVFTYSIANFPTLRCLEQIRNDICYHGFPVTIVSVGAGLAYGNLGFSHHGIQDIATLRCMPNITIASPADPEETRGCLAYLIANPGPSYLRLGKAGEPQLHRVPIDGLRPLNLIDGKAALAIVGTGAIVATALEAARQLRECGLDCSVFSVPFLAPSNGDAFNALWQMPNIITVEEHVAAGGLGSLIKENAPHGVRVRSLCVNESLFSAVGSQKTLWEANGLTADALVLQARQLLQ